MANSDGIPGPAIGQGLGAGEVNLLSLSCFHIHIILTDTTILHFLAVSFFCLISSDGAVVTLFIMISASRIHELVQMHSEFSIKWIAADGRIINIPSCRCTSFYGNGDTMNIIIPASGEVRTVNRNTIIEFNGEEVIL